MLTPVIVAMMIRNISHQKLTKKCEMLMTMTVGNGSSAPKFLNTSSNDGITNTMITQMTTIATTSTDIG